MFCFKCSSIEYMKMNEIKNTFLVAGDKFMPEIHRNNLVLLIVLVAPLLKRKKELKSLCRLKTQI